MYQMVAVVGITVAAATLPAVAQESRLERVLESGTLRVGTTGDFKPMSFKDPATGDYQGYDYQQTKNLLVSYDEKPMGFF